MNFKLDLHIRDDYFLNGEAIYDALQTPIRVFLHVNMEYKVWQGHLIDETYQCLFNEKQILKVLTIQPIDSLIQIHYHGLMSLPLASNQVLLDDYAELAIYSGAYPALVHPEFINIDAKIHVSSNRKIIGIKKDNDCYRYQEYAIDIPLVICPQNIHHVKSQNVDIYSYPPQKTKQLMNMLTNVQKIYNDLTCLLGQCDKKDVTIVLNPRQIGGAYVRKHLICLQDKIEGLDEKSFIHLAHELSHFWWSQGQLDIQNDWLNESFAQYSALMIAKDIWGEEVFVRSMKAYEKESKGLPGLMTLDENTDSGTKYLVHYQKGPYVLYCLQEYMGMGAMKQWLQCVYKQKIKTTQELLSTLQDEDKDFLWRLLSQ